MTRPMPVSLTPPLENPWLRSLPSYVPGKPAMGDGNGHKLSANESPLGPSASAIKAFCDTGAGLGVYPEPTSLALRNALAQRWLLDAERMVCGGGSDELLVLLARAYLAPGTSAICSEHGFALYPMITQACGANPIIVSEASRRSDVDAILGALRSDTKAVWLANPNNPTGTMLSDNELRSLHSRIPQDVLLILDGAYAEYLPEPEKFPGLSLIDEASNVVMVRTFSKLYGLAGLRVGWLYGPSDVVSTLNRIREPFNVSSAAQAAAIAAVGDRDHESAARRHNVQWRRWLSDQINALGFSVTPSEANFLLVDFLGKVEDASGAGGEARQVYEVLLNDGIAVREASGYGFPHSLRISVGTEVACHTLIESLKRYVDCKA